MLIKLIAALSAVALLFPMLFFTFASPPLLILKHDTPQDGRFVRGLFHHYYTVVAFAASVGTLVQLAIGHFGVAAGMAGVAALAFSLHRWVIPRMDALRERINSGDTTAITQFRQLHIAGMLLNVVQLALVAWGVIALFTQL